MSDTQEVQTEKRTTSAEIKKQIEEAQRAENASKKKTDLLKSGLPMSAIADQINAISTTENRTSTGSKSEPAQITPAQPATERETAPSQESVDLKEWKKKKGINWDTPDSVALELRRMDQEFHRKQAENKKREVVERPAPGPASPPAWNQPAPYAPPAYGYPPPAYAPPNNRALVENLARQYNMTPEDFERVTAVQRDLTEAMLAQERKRHADELEAMRRENIKNSEFRELSADPVFRRPEVMVEFHNVLEQMQQENPESFSQDPFAYRKAADRAFQNIGRRVLESSGVQEEVSGFQLPKTPPKPISNSGTGRTTNENSLTEAEFNRLSVGEQRAYMEKMGLVQPKY